MEDKKVLSLVKKAIKGNREAFGNLCELKAREITYLCLREMGNSEDGKDAAQEVFIRMHQSITKLRSPDAFHVWLNRVILSTCNDMRRKTMKQPKTVYFEDAPEKENIVDLGSAMPVNFVETEENRRLIVELVDALPPKYRQCVWLHYYQKLSYAEIAQVLDIPRDAVNNNLRMARQYLKNKLEKEHGGYHSLAAVPMMAMGPALVKVFEGSAASEVPLTMAQECLAKAGVAAKLPGAKLLGSAAAKAAAGLFTFALAASVVCAAYYIPKKVTGPAAGGQSQSVASVPVQTLPTALVGRVSLPADENGEVAAPAAGTQIALLAPGGEVVAVTPLLRDGSFAFEGLQLSQTGQYTLQVLQSESGAELAVQNLVITLTEDGAWQI